VSTQSEAYKAVKRALKDDPLLRGAAVEEITHQLVRKGYSREEPPIWLVTEVLGTVAAEEQAFAPGIRPADV
jgi:hypothetical protein